MFPDNHRLMTAEDAVYLLHFERPYKGRSRHYLGFTCNLKIFNCVGY